MNSVFCKKAKKMPGIVISIGRLKMIWFLGNTVLRISEWVILTILHRFKWFLTSHFIFNS